MALRPFWKGYMKLSLVTCPVAMTPATSEEDKVRFHVLNRRTGNRILSQSVDAETGRPVGEEFGLVVCLMILALFAFVTLRAMSRASKETSLFITLAATGLGVQFGLQAAINMASTIQLIPAKGMTLPFISYGGSSALAMAIAVGMMLSLTREHAGLREAV